MTTTTMTRKAFFETALELFAKTGNTELQEYATAELQKMEKASETRRNKPTKAALENAPLAAAIVETILADGSTKLTVEIAAALRELFPEMEISTQKTSGILRNLVKEGAVTTEKIKVVGKGEQSAYTIAATETTEE